MKRGMNIYTERFLGPLPSKIVTLHVDMEPPADAFEDIMVVTTNTAGGRSIDIRHLVVAIVVTQVRAVLVVTVIRVEVVQAALVTQVLAVQAALVTQVLAATAIVLTAGPAVASPANRDEQNDYMY